MAWAAEALGRPSDPSSTLDRQLNRRAFVTGMGGMLLASARPIRAPLASDAVATISSLASPAVQPSPKFPAPLVERTRSYSLPPAPQRFERITGSSQDLLHAVTRLLGSRTNLERRWLPLATRTREALGDAAAAIGAAPLGYSLTRQGAASDPRLSRTAGYRRIAAWAILRVAASAGWRG